MERSGLFLKLNFLSILGIFLLFAFGGLVRATGSGMGCPDWPKCFGSYVPPTSADHLPDNYKDIFLNERLKKAERFAALLLRLGFEEKAHEILMYDKLQEAHEFSAPKAYTEYINRLWGALTGLFVLGNLLVAFPLIRRHRNAFWLTLGGFVLVVLNALLGAVVVHANLLGGIVTSHFLLAFAAMALFLWARFSYAPLSGIPMKNGSRFSAWLLMGMILVQLLAGTQVREVYDVLDAQQQSFDAITISQLGRPFHIHRTMAIVTLLIAFLQLRRFGQEQDAARLNGMARWQLIMIVTQVVFGSLIVMTDLSAFSKFFHITIGAAIFTLQFYICSLAVRQPKTEQHIAHD